MSISIERPTIDIELGQRLPDNPARQKLQRMIARACEEIGMILGPDRLQTHVVNTLNAKLPDIPNVSIIEKGDAIKHIDYTCIHYAFGEILGEDWAMPHNPIDYEFQINPVDFLFKKGYSQIASPVPGCVVAYTDSSEWSEGGTNQLHHYGILDDHGHVVSKLARGPIVNHPLEVVSLDYGDTVFFFAKTQDI